MIKEILIGILQLTHIYAGPTRGDIMPGRIGGQHDDNNCLIGAGYSWCEDLQNCIRHWETPCKDNYNDCDDCLLRQQNGENIACPLECNNNCINDDNCEDTHFCRVTTSDYNGPKECVKYSDNGESCGGYTLPNYQNRCNPLLECVNTLGPMVADAPGTCFKPCNSGYIRNDYGECINPGSFPSDNICIFDLLRCSDIIYKKYSYNKFRKTKQKKI